MAEDVKAQLRDYWRNFKNIFPRKSLEDGKTRSRAWAMDLKLEIKVEGDLDKNWEAYIDQYLDELEVEWEDW
jgi:hypothetical protein